MVAVEGLANAGEVACACKRPEVRKKWKLFVGQTRGTYLQEYMDESGNPDGHKIRGTCRSCFSDLGFEGVLRPETR